MKTYVGKAHPRVEDSRLLRGRGRYVGDLAPANCLCAAFVRSPYAHAKLLDIRKDSVSHLTEVLLVLTGADWSDAGLGLLPSFWHVTSVADKSTNAALQSPLARGKVRYVGEPVAVVIATSAAAAQDGAEALEVEYEELVSVTDTASALNDDAAIVHETFGTNRAFEVRHGNEEETARSLARSHHITRLQLINNRVSASPLEPRSIVAEYEPATDRYTLWAPSQNPHVLRNVIAERTLFIPEHRLRVISPDVGGAFGQRSYHFPEEAVLLRAAKLLGYPVRWTSTRSELLIADPHARDHVTAGEIGFDREGRITGLKIDTIAAVGAYLSAYGPGVAAYKYPRGLSGQYAIPSIYCRVVGAYTNTALIEVYRGAGHPEAALILERLMDTGARELGIDPMELRARNLFRTQDFPIATATGLTYDSGDFAGLMQKMRDKAGYDALLQEQQRLRAQGVLMGVGIAAFIDTSGGMPTAQARRAGRITGSFDVATVRVHPSGNITLLCGTHNHGQGHATTYAQIVADRLGCQLEAIDVRQGDTDLVPFGQGTYGSRSTIVLGTALINASDRIIEKGRILAAHLLECAEGDLLFQDGQYCVKGTDRSIAFREIADAAYRGVTFPEGFEPGLEAIAFVEPAGLSTQSGIHLCVAIVDAETGEVALRDYMAIDDVGKIINPLIAHGQMHGAIAQGIGQALMEHCLYDPASGQLLSGSLLDYALPRASDMPSFSLAFQETPASSNPLGAKGLGECGTVGAPAAVANAVMDALHPLGVRHIDLPLTPSRVWNAIQAARGKLG